MNGLRSLGGSDDRTRQRVRGLRTCGRCEGQNQEQTGADMLMWNGACIVHDEFKGLELDLLKAQHPGAKVLVHPESPKSVVEQADVVGSTSQILNAVLKSDAQTFIIATDNGMMHRIRQLAPTKTLIEAPTAGNSATCKSCAHCPWMAMNALQGVVQCLEQGSGEILIDEPVRAQALGCIDRMLDFVAAQPERDAEAGAGEEHRRRLTMFERDETLEEAAGPQHPRRADGGHRPPRLDRPSWCRPASA